MLNESSVNTSTILIPCRDEAGNIVKLIEKLILEISTNDSILIVEGGSKDETWELALELQKRFHPKVRTIKQTGRGKFAAILTSKDFIDSDLTFIYDSDRTISVDDNLRILQNCKNQSGTLCTGNRLSGKRDQKSMKKLNLIGNYIFALLWSVISVSKPIDVLCGSKCFPSSLLNNIPQKMIRIDYYGDFSILFTSLFMSLKVESIPVNYTPRTYGKTKINPWVGGMRLLRAYFVGALITISKFGRKPS